MAEVKTPLRHLTEGDIYVADADGAYVIEGTHTHSDILRYVVADIGADDVRALLDNL